MGPGQAEISDASGLHVRAGLRGDLAEDDGRQSECGANAMIRKAAERTAINTPIQGTAADMIKLAMVHMAARLRESALKCRMILQVHDELVFELPECELPEAKELVTTTMRDALKLSVPVVVEMGAGKSWFEAHA